MIRAGTLDDADAIRDLTRAAYAKWMSVIGREPLPMNVDYVRALKNHRFDLLYQGDFLAALLETIDMEDHLLIENVAVSPDFQKLGFGRQLLQLAEKITIERGYSKLKLFTNKAFAENIALYLKLGYQIERKEPFREGFTVYMEKNI